MQCLIHIRRSRARWLRKEPFLKLGGSALSLHHSWDGLVQNVINMFCTFLWCDFLCPEFLDAIHHKTLIGQLLSNEWDQSSFKDITEEISIHDAIKDTDLCGTMSANPTPNMNFNWMPQFWLALHQLVDLPVACTAVLLKGNGAFVREDHIVKGVATFQHTPSLLQSFRLVWGSDELTISRLL